MDVKIGTAKLLDQYYTGKQIAWLRRLRNRYVHVNIDDPPELSVDAQYDCRMPMESDARKAIQIVIHSLLQSPGT